jgi:hypothetical protein
MTLLVSPRPISSDSDISGGGGVGRQPVPWLLVPGPVAGVERLRADVGCLRLEALMTRIGVRTVTGRCCGALSTASARHVSGTCAGSLGGGAWCWWMLEDVCVCVGGGRGCWKMGTADAGDGL